MKKKVNVATDNVEATELLDRMNATRQQVADFLNYKKIRQISSGMKYNMRDIVNRLKSTTIDRNVLNAINTMSRLKKYKPIND